MNGKVYDLITRPSEALGIKELRRQLISQATGKVLEVGAGSGLNFKHFPAGTEVTAVEADPSMRERAHFHAKRYPHIRVENQEAESLPYPDGTFDTVVTTMALCSVDDLQAALREAHRVLKPEGRLLVMEHIRKESLLAGALLDLLTPPWKWISRGCRLNRRTGRFIAESGFKVEKHETLWNGFGGLWVLRK